MSILTHLAARRFLLSVFAGFLLALCFLRWQWLPETADGKITAYVIGLVFVYLFSYGYFFDLVERKKE